jgi:hypothetical protein
VTHDWSREALHPAIIRKPIARWGRGGLHLSPPSGFQKEVAVIRRQERRSYCTNPVANPALNLRGVGSFAQRYHVDQPRTQIKRKGNSGGDLHRTAGPSLRCGRGAASQQRSRPPQRGAFAQHEACIRQDKTGLNLQVFFLSLFLIVAPICTKFWHSKGAPPAWPLWPVLQTVESWLPVNLTILGGLARWKVVS